MADKEYEPLANRLLIAYTKSMLDLAQKNASRRIHINGQQDSRIIRSLERIFQDLSRYDNPESLERALNVIDLAKIYSGVDQRERTSDSSDLGYEDFVVLETLNYFKTDFFSWVNRPMCPTCHEDAENIVPKGSKGPPLANPNEISMIELYTCTNCKQIVEFSRINNPAKLLETRRGRCGEWVNCFMLILKAILGPEAQIRYIWNAEDHVWCEYYSTRLQRWIHLDPCENVFDEPSLYSKNWGKRMSWILGVGNNYIVDLSEKYVTEHDKMIRKDTVANEQTIARFLTIYNAQLLLRRWNILQLLDSSPDDSYLSLYYEVLLPQAKDRISHKIKTSKCVEAPRGRQTGDTLWTTARGENG